MEAEDSAAGLKYRAFVGALTEKMWRRAARIFGFWPGFGEGAGSTGNPVTEPKRRQKAKKTAVLRISHSTLQL
jgi:hypothetical protein